MEMATAVVGLVGVGAQISLVLGQFISGCANAPALVKSVHREINDFNNILSLLQPLLLGSSPLKQSRASMIYVDQLTLTLTGCVCTLSEMEKEVNGLKPSGRMGVWDRLKWSRIESTISQLFQRLRDHKSSLTLILTILTSASLTEATNSSVILLNSSLFGALGSTNSTTAGLDSDVDDSESIMTVTDTRVVNFYRLTCESVLFTTWPYRGMSNNSVISLASSQRPKPSWSLISEGSNRSVLSLPVSDYEFSGASLAETSDMSTLSLPISADNLRNSRWYGSNIDTVPPNLISTRDRVLLRLFRSGDKILPSPHIKLLHQAAKLGQMITIKLLLEQGADMEEKDEGGNTALHIAARNNRVSVVELLLDRGADIGAKCSDGETPLHCAAFNSHDSTVGLLLDRGADIEAKCSDGETPLHHAAFNGHESTVGLLLDRWANIEAKNQDGYTPLHNTASNGHDSTVRLLLDRGADMGAKTVIRSTALHRAAQGGHDSTVGLLLDRGADMGAKTMIIFTALHCAAQGGHDSTVGLLLDRGANMEAKTLCESTALHRAAQGGHDSTVGLLLDWGADIEAKDRGGEVPLHRAAFNGHESTVGLLLGRGADKQAKNQSGKTPFDLVQRGRYPALYQLLQETYYI